MMIRKFTLSAVAGVVTFVATSSVAPPTVAAERTVARTARVAPANIERLRLDAPLTRGGATAAVDSIAAAQPRWTTGAGAVQVALCRGIGRRESG